MTAVADPLTELAYWATWQDMVTRALPHFAAQGVYVEQDSVDPTEVERVVRALDHYEDLPGRIRDKLHGARVFSTRIGPVTRMWVDANVEIAYLRERCSLATSDVLEVGAGYGRLAVMLAPHVHAYACVDAVPVSVRLCRAYVAQYTDRPIAVYDVAGFRAAGLRPTLAINIHSWNECTRGQIAQWLDAIDALGTRLLFTVSHGRTEDGTAYRTCEPGEPDFKGILLDRYRLLDEVSVGIGGHPHALWGRA